MPDREPLESVAAQIEGALDLLVDALRSSVAEVHDDLVGRGLDPAEDASHFSASVRRYTLEVMKPSFPDLIKRNNNMSPIHLILGPHELRMLHARDGELPRPQTEARRAYYEQNDQGILELNVYPPDQMVAIPEDETAVEEATLVLLWDSEGPELTILDLYRPSMTSWPGERLRLFTAPEAEEDLDEIADKREPAEDEGETPDISGS